MTDSISPSFDTCPESVVRLGDIALAAGLAGDSMTLCYDDFPAPVLCQIWKRLARRIGADRVFHARTQHDVNGIVRSISAVPLVFVQATRLHNALSWAVQMHNISTGPKPLIVCQGVPDGLDESPGPAIVLRGGGRQSESALNALLQQQPAAWTGPDEGSTADVQIPNWLLPLTQPSAGEKNRGPRRLRDRLVLQALVRGARLYRQLENVPCVTEESLDVEPCDYESVRDLLRSSLIASADEPVDPLAVAMVARSNVYLQLKHTPELWQENPSFRLDGDPLARLRGSRTQRELITRREIAELGNVRSQLVRQIVDSLKQLPDGHALFQRMGLMRRPPSESSWPSRSASALLGLLHQWSYKQVRRHFDDLKRRGMITADREHDNGPWQYLLPEELSASTSPFQHLPLVEQQTQIQ
jgi:hypothetical protein